MCRSCNVTEMRANFKIALCVSVCLWVCVCVCVCVCVEPVLNRVGANSERAGSRMQCVAKVAVGDRLRSKEAALVWFRLYCLCLWIAGTKLIERFFSVGLSVSVDWDRGFFFSLFGLQLRQPSVVDSLTRRISEAVWLETFALSCYCSCSCCYGSCFYYATARTRGPCFVFGYEEEVAVVLTMNRRWNLLKVWPLSLTVLFLVTSNCGLANGKRFIGKSHNYPKNNNNNNQKYTKKIWKEKFQKKKKMIISVCVCVCVCVCDTVMVFSFPNGWPKWESQWKWRNLPRPLIELLCIELSVIIGSAAANRYTEEDCVHGTSQRERRRRGRRKGMGGGGEERGEGAEAKLDTSERK